MQKIEEILDAAINRLKNGEEISSVLSSYPELRNNLSASLNLAKVALSLPKRQIPAPLKRKMFLQTKPQSTMARIMDSFKIYAFALGALALLITGTIYAAENSAAGDKLFFARKAVENLRLSLASNPAKKAELQITFANSRLEEAQTAADGNDSEKTAAAVNELNSQTEIALNNLKQVASNKDLGKNTIKNAQSLAAGQAKLVAKVDPTNATAIVQSNEKTVQAIIAASNDQTAASISNDTPIDVTGNISSISLKDNKLVIDKNTFTFDPQNINVLDKSGKKLLLSDLAVNDNVQILGEAKGAKNTITTITLITKAPVESKTSAVPLPSSGQTPEPTKPNDTFGGFIPESSN